MTGFERGAPNGIHGNKTDGVSNKTTNIYNIHNIYVHSTTSTTTRTTLYHDQLTFLMNL